MEHSSSHKAAVDSSSSSSTSSSSSAFAQGMHGVKSHSHPPPSSFSSSVKGLHDCEGGEEGNGREIDLLARSLGALSVRNSQQASRQDRSKAEAVKVVSSTADTPPTKEDTPPSKEDTLQRKENTLPSKEDTLPRKEECHPGEESDSSVAFSGNGCAYILPARITNALYAHQREGIKWLWGLHVKGVGGILADDMGLGKTMQIAAFLAGLFASGLINRALIIAPKTLVAHWLKELSNVGLSTKTKDYSGCGGSGRDNALLHILQAGGLLLTTYDIVRNNWQALRGEVHSVHGNNEIDDDSVTWDYVILDEGHLIKNPKTQRAKSLQQIPSLHRIVISGTPIQNNLREMWALFNFCYPKLLGDIKVFKEKYEDPILDANDKNATDRQRMIGSAVAQELRKRISPFFLRRLKCEVFPTSVHHVDQKISCKNDIIVWLRLTECQRQLYSAFLQSDAARLPLTGSSKGSALAALTVLKKICDHPCLLTKRAANDITDGMDSVLADLDSASAEALFLSVAHSFEADGSYKDSDAAISCKLIFILSLLRKLADEGHRTLVFSQTRKMLNVIQNQLELQDFSFLRIDGTTTTSDRERLVQEFQENNEIPIFLLTSQVGGLGLTLTGADRVIIVDPAWNPSTDNQSVDRAYRIGQKKDVLVYRLMTCGTIEEKIYRKQVFKGGIFRVATEHKEQFRYFSQQDLQELLSLPRSGFDISLTQQQLEAEHSNQYKIDKKMREHILFLKAQGIAGVSHHDLLFSKQDSTCSLGMSTDSRRLNDQGSTLTSKSSYLDTDKSNHVEKCAYSVKDVEERTEQLKIQAIKENINRLSQTLADKATISRLPDNGFNIKRRISDLTNQLRQLNSC